MSAIQRRHLPKDDKVHSSEHALYSPKSKGAIPSFSTKSAMILVFGLLVGYVAIPMALVERNTGQFYSRNASHYEPKLRSLTATTSFERLIEDRQILSTQSLPTPISPNIMKTQDLSDHRRKKILVTGGAGFVGSHLVDKLMMEGHEVTVMDNFFTGQKKNIAHWLQHPSFR
jgi:hypothetical protein